MVVMIPEAQAENRGPLQLCEDHREWQSNQLSTSDGINLHILTLLLVTGNSVNIVGEDQCMACKARDEIAKELLKRIVAFKKAGLFEVVVEEEAKLAWLTALAGSGWLIEHWLPIEHKGQLTAGVQMCRLINKEARHGNNG